MAYQWSEAESSLGRIFLITFDRLEEVASGLQSRIGAMVTFWGEPHGCSVGTTSIRINVIATAELTTA
jgi:hypothetical protein